MLSATYMNKALVTLSRVVFRHPGTRYPLFLFLFAQYRCAVCDSAGNGCLSASRVRKDRSEEWIDHLSDGTA